MFFVPTERFPALQSSRLKQAALKTVARREKPQRNLGLFAAENGGFELHRYLLSSEPKRLLFATDDEILSKPGVVRSVYDPTAGTGGMLSVADDYIRNLNPEASLTLFGQELNGESYAIAKADMVIKGQDIENMVWGDTLTNDGHHGKYFDYCLANPPFGVEWKKQQAFVEREHRDRGFDGRLEKKTEIRESLAELQSPLGGADIRASNL